MADPIPQLLPHDEHNRELESNVHPPQWKNPTPSQTYHLVVIGAGTAGLVTAAGAAGLGARVALIERELMGGDCLNVGCVPSKGVIGAARVAASVRGRSEFTWHAKSDRIATRVGAGGDEGDDVTGVRALMQHPRRLIPHEQHRSCGLARYPLAGKRPHDDPAGQRQLSRAASWHSKPRARRRRPTKPARRGCASTCAARRSPSPPQGLRQEACSRREREGRG